METEEEYKRVLYLKPDKMTNDDILKDYEYARRLLGVNLDQTLSMKVMETWCDAKVAAIKAAGLDPKDFTYDEALEFSLAEHKAILINSVGNDIKKAINDE